MKNWQFPMPGVEDKMPKTVAETVDSFVSAGKTTAAWQGEGFHLSRLEGITPPAIPARGWSVILHAPLEYHLWLK